MSPPGKEGEICHFVGSLPASQSAECFAAGNELIHTGIVGYVGAAAVSTPCGSGWAQSELSSKGIMMSNELRAATLGVTLSLLGIAGLGTAGVAQAGPLAGLTAQIGESGSPLWTLAQAKKKPAPARARTQRPPQQPQQQQAPQQPSGGSGMVPG